VITDISKYAITRPPRPMLAREADGVYWMSRYVERSEHIARLLRTKMSMLADSGDMDESLLEGLWMSVPQVFRQHKEGLAGGGSSAMEAKIAAHVTFDDHNPNSLINCLTRARENARGVRETISAEMWEELNAVYWMIRSDDARQRFDESPDAFLKNVLSASMLFQGLADQTLRHDQRWQFVQLGKYIERVDYTARVTSIHWTLLTEAEETLDLALRNIHWMGLVRACCAIEAYKRANLGEIDGLRVASFLTLEPGFPRSIRYAVRGAYDAISAVADESDARKADAPQRLLGRLDAQLEYAEVSELVEEGVPRYLSKIEAAIADVAVALQRGYFLL
jgi:uncharacterized alpha-E superfamily protein